MTSLKRRIRLLLPEPVIRYLVYPWRRWRARAPAVLTTRDSFARIYQENLWGGEKGEFYSGWGSDTSIAQSYVENVRRFIRDHDIATIVDLGCGDFRVGEQLLMPGVSITGVDIVEPLIERNRKNFAGLAVSFLCLDATVDDLPPADLLLVRQVLQHLSNEQIAKILKKLQTYKYAIVSEHQPVVTDSFNLDMTAGPGIRLSFNSGVYPDKPPFSLAARVLFETPVPAEWGPTPSKITSYLLAREAPQGIS